MRTRYILTLPAALFALLLSCTGNFAEYNRNPSEATLEQMKRDRYDVGSKLLQLQNLVVPTQEHLYQITEILAGHAYGGYSESTISDWAAKFSTFNPSTAWLKAPLYDVLVQTYPPYRGIIKATDDVVALALADVLRVAIMHRVTDQHGPIPYSKIVEDQKELLTVPYDTQQEVYSTMFGELDDAIEVLDANSSLSAEAFGDYDLVYGGNMAKWAGFARSLKLRMAMRLAYVDAQTARTKADEAIEGGVIESNADNALFHAPLNRAAMIWNDWKDHVASADLQSYLNGFADPRNPKIFTLHGGAVHGMRIGTTPSDKSEAATNYSFPVIKDTDPFLWMNAAEVAFLRAEYALRWGTMAEAGKFYADGVTLSFEQWGVKNAAEGYLASDAKPANYTDPMPGQSAYNHTAASTITPKWNDAADTEEALERIITQKWIAIYPLGNEAWAEYRRTGYPRLMPVPDEFDRSGGTVNLAIGARRIQFPTEEYAENRANVTAAVNANLGGRDTAGAKVWWDSRN